MKKRSASSQPKKNSPPCFDPFNNRLSRDIRNTLSEAFVDALVKADSGAYHNTAQKWLRRALDNVYVDYIQDRLERYDHVFEQVRANRINDDKLQALIIWNQGLFFEVHEHLERIWQAATGDEQLALKGLIQASAVYLHLKFNHRQAAERLAIKSSGYLKKHASHLNFIANLSLLIDRLEKLEEQPPYLRNPHLRSIRSSLSDS